MPSPFYGTDAVYGLRALLGTSNVDDIDAGFAALRDDIASKMKGAVPRVTSLPTVGPSGSGPLVNGQECYLVADAANGVLWHLRYNSSSSSALKWEYVGGSALAATVDALETTTSNSFTDLATVGPTVTLPALANGGDFDILLGADIMCDAVGYAYMSISIAGGAAQTFDAAVRQGQASEAVPTSVVMSRRKLAVVGAATITAKYRTNGITGEYTGRFLSVRPVRVG